MSEPPPSTSQVLGLQKCATMPGYLLHLYLQIQQNHLKCTEQPENTNRDNKETVQGG